MDAQDRTDAGTRWAWRRCRGCAGAVALVGRAAVRGEPEGSGCVWWRGSRAGRRRDPGVWYSGSACGAGRSGDRAQVGVANWGQSRISSFQRMCAGTMKFDSDPNCCQIPTSAFKSPPPLRTSRMRCRISLVVALAVSFPLASQRAEGQSKTTRPPDRREREGEEEKEREGKRPVMSARSGPDEPEEMEDLTRELWKFARGKGYDR